MPQDNLEQLQKLTKLINTDRIISPEEIEQVISVLVTILARNKEAVERMSEETREEVLTSLADSKRQLDEALSQVRELTGSTQENVTTGLKQAVEDVYRQLDELAADIKASAPKDGKDADPSAVVPLVIEQIKLPEYKETVLDGGEQIVDKINDLPTDEDDKKIDAKHIKNLPKGGETRIIGSPHNIAWFDESTLVSEHINKVKFTGSGVQAALNSEGTLVITVTGTASTETDEIATDSGNHTTFTISNTPNAGTLLVYNGDTGQIFAPSLYSNVTTSITFNSSLEVGSETPVVRAKYGY